MKRAPGPEDFDRGQSGSARGRKLAAWAAAGVASATLLACANVQPPAPVSRPTREDPALLSPLSGYPLTAPAALAARVEALFESLMTGGDPAQVSAGAETLLAEAPDFHPASVLAAQVDYLKLDHRGVLARLDAIAAELPDYAACQVLRGFAAERAGEIVTAYEAFVRVAQLEESRGALEASRALAGERAADLRDRVAEIVFNRLKEALGRGRTDLAESHRAWLEEWIGDERIVLEAARQILSAEEDREGERAAVCRLAELEPLPEVRQRCAELEIEVGDVRAGLELFEQLAAESPADPILGQQLERAKFRWRLELLPDHVRELGRKGELTRADLATLLYWLVPQVRSSRVVDPPIATDILEHPRRDEILKVADLALMRVDEVLHRFDPDRPATRLTTFAALLRLLNLAGRGASCLGGAELRALPAARSWVCRVAASCGLIPEAAECLPRAAISGDEALDFFRHSLDLIGAGPGASS